MTSTEADTELDVLRKTNLGTGTRYDEVNSAHLSSSNGSNSRCTTYGPGQRPSRDGPGVYEAAAKANGAAGR